MNMKQQAEQSVREALSYAITREDESNPCPVKIENPGTVTNFYLF